MSLLIDAIVNIWDKPSYTIHSKAISINEMMLNKTLSRGEMIKLLRDTKRLDTNELLALSIELLDL